MVEVCEVSGSFGLSLHPAANVFGSVFGECVGALSVSQVILPLPVINVAVRVFEGALAVSSVVYPLSFVARAVWVVKRAAPMFSVSIITSNVA